LATISTFYVCVDETVELKNLHKESFLFYLYFFTRTVVQRIILRKIRCPEQKLPGRR
jgi:hypothetical protein